MVDKMPSSDFMRSILGIPTPMLPSSSGLGRSPPQVENGGSSPSGSAIPDLCRCHGPLSCYGGSITSCCRLDRNKPLDNGGY